MDFSFTDDQIMLRKEIIRFAQRELNDDMIERDRQQIFSREMWKKCGEMGLTGLPIDEKYGGNGFDPLSTAIALEAFGYACVDSGLVFSVGAHLLACVVPIWKHAGDDLMNKYFPGLCNGDIIAINAMSEPGSGSDAFSMRTRGEKVDGGWVINGTKTFASNGPVGDIALTFVVTDPEKGYHGGITAFIVESGTEGFRCSSKYEKMGLRTSPIGELVYEDVFVSDAQVIGGVGGGATLFTSSMDWERICLFASHVGSMERIVESAIKYARTRDQFGKKISKHQAVAHRIADMKVMLEASRLLTYKAAWKLDRKRDVSLDAAIAKVFVSESLQKVALSAVQVFGGYGFMTEYEMERELRNAVGATLYSGTSEMQRNIIAGWLGL